MVRTVFIQVLTLSLMILLGYVLGKRRYITAEHSDFLSRLVLDVFFPCSVISAASGDFGGGGSRLYYLAAAALYFGVLLVFFVLGRLVGGLLGLDEDERLIFANSASYANNGFMGLPLCGAIFGPQGTLWASLSIPGTTLYVFVVLTTSLRRERSSDWKSRLKSLLTPLNLSAVAMIVMILTGWKLTGPLYTAVNSLGTCNTPAAMLLIGYLLSASPLVDALRRPAVYGVTLLRNLLCPLLGALVLRLTPWDRGLCLCLVVVMGCSVAATVSIFAARYRRAPGFAGQSMLQSTLLLPLTMPVMIYLAERILR